MPFCTGREIVGSSAGYVALIGGIHGLDSDYAPGVDVPTPNVDLTILDIVTMAELQGKSLSLEAGRYGSKASFGRYCQERLVVYGGTDPLDLTHSTFLHSV